MNRTINNFGKAITNGVVIFIMNNNINILVVEDDEDINNLLYKILDKQGYRVTSAYSGSEG